MNNAREKRTLDMIHGSIWNKIPRFALPVAATAILEQLFNASDVAVVGNFTGEAKTVSVAAVGANSPIISLIVNLFIGIALGTNVVIANAIGRNDRDTVRKTLHTSVLVAIFGGIFVAFLGEAAAAPILGMLNVPEDVFPLALLYLRIYLIGMPVILLYNCGRHENPSCRSCFFRGAERASQPVFCGGSSYDSERCRHCYGNIKRDKLGTAVHKAAPH